MLRRLGTLRRKGIHPASGPSDSVFAKRDLRHAGADEHLDRPQHRTAASTTSTPTSPTARSTTARSTTAIRYRVALDEMFNFYARLKGSRSMERQLGERAVHPV